MKTKQSRSTRRSTSRRAVDVDDLIVDERRVERLDTVATVLQVQLLRDIFPAVEYAMLQDVLVAAEFQIDLAAAMLGELARDPVKTVDHSSSLEASLVMELSSEEEAEWDEVAAWANPTAAAVQRPDLQQWVMVQDEWEVVDMEGERVRSFADVLRTEAVKQQQTVPAKIHRPRNVRKLTSKKSSSVGLPADFFYAADAAYGPKSFGAHKRIHMKHRR